MYTVKVRLYRSHDFDLMVLSQTGIISVASIARKALEACFKGEDYHVNIKGVTKPVPEKLGNSLSTRVVISDERCPGIESWFRGFAQGARNNMIKCLIRKALNDVPIWAYRIDGWVSAEAEAEEVQKVLASISKQQTVQKAEKPKKEAVKKAPTKTSKEKPAQPGPKVELSEKEKVETIKPQAPKAEEIPDTTGIPDNTDESEDDDFDAFEAFSALVK